MSAQSVQKDEENIYKFTKSLYYPDVTKITFESDVSVAWWTIGEDPIEDYKLKWQKGNTYKFPNGKSISRGQLSKYPDLLKQFNDIKPTYLEFIIEFDAKSQGAFGNRNLSVKVNTNGIIIPDENKNPPFSMPESRSWQQFLNSNSFMSADELSMLWRDPNTILSVKDLRLRSIEWPNFLFANIYEEYKRRTGKPLSQKEKNDLREDDPSVNSDWATGKDIENITQNKVVKTNTYQKKKSTKTKNKTSINGKLTGKIEKYSAKGRWNQTVYGLKINGKIIVPARFKYLYDIEDGRASVREVIKIYESTCRTPFQDKSEKLCKIDVYDGIINMKGEWISKKLKTFPTRIKF